MLEKFSPTELDRMDFRARNPIRCIISLPNNKALELGFVRTGPVSSAKKRELLSSSIACNKNLPEIWRFNSNQALYGPAQ